MGGTGGGNGRRRVVRPSVFVVCTREDGGLGRSRRTPFLTATAGRAMGIGEKQWGEEAERGSCRPSGSHGRAASAVRLDPAATSGMSRMLPWHVHRQTTKKKKHRCSSSHHPPPLGIESISPILPLCSPLPPPSARRPLANSRADCIPSPYPRHLPCPLCSQSRPQPARPPWAPSWAAPRSCRQRPQWPRGQTR